MVAATVRKGMRWETCTGISNDTSRLQRVFNSLKVTGSASERKLFLGNCVADVARFLCASAA